MARIHKVEMYLVDANDYYDDVELAIENMVERSEFYSLHVKAQSSKEIEWDDDIDFNHTDCTKESCEAYFVPQ